MRQQVFHSTIQLFLVLVFIGFALPKASVAQPVLQRISVTERSDNLGFVVRFHLTEPVDSFRFVQPELHKVQLVLFHDEIETEGFRAPDTREIVESIKVMNPEKGTGFELRISEDHLLQADLYRDRNQRDLLLSLQRTAREELAEEIDGQSPMFTGTIRRTSADTAKDTTATATANNESFRQDTSGVDEKLTTNDTGKRNTAFYRFLDHKTPDVLQKIAPGDPMELYVRGIYLNESQADAPTFVNRNRILELPEGTVHPWQNRDRQHYAKPTIGNGRFSYRLFAPEIYRSNNSEIPMGQNDGALWQGRGTNFGITGGAGVQYGPFTAVFKPYYTYSENLAFPFEDFDISVHPRFADSEFQTYLTYADIPLRFGDSSVSQFDLGDSFLRADYNGFAAGISNERIWSGPAIHNPLIFSYNAPGFLHGFIGTGQPYETGWGNLEGRWLWGSLEESDFFDTDPANDRRFITSFSLSFSPSTLSGLTVGLTRAAYSYPRDGLSVGDIFLAFRMPPVKPAEENSDPEGAYVTMSSIYARWVFPEAGFEAYAEWGKNDYRRYIRDLLAEPQLNRGYVLGLLKNFEFSPTHKLLFNIEITNLQNSSVPATKRDFNIWYTNPVVDHGFTQRGQVIGAGIGPGSSTQQIHLNYYNRWGMVGISVRRIAHYMDRHFKYEDYFRSFSDLPEYYFILSRHEVEMRLGARVLFFLPFNLELEANYEYGSVHNRYNVRDSDVINHHVSFTLRYTFDRF